MTRTIYRVVGASLGVAQSDFVAAVRVAMQPRAKRERGWQDLFHASEAYVDQPDRFVCRFGTSRANPQAAQNREAAQKHAKQTTDAAIFAFVTHSFAAAHCSH